MQPSEPVSICSFFWSLPGEHSYFVIARRALHELLILTVLCSSTKQSHPYFLCEVTINWVLLSNYNYLNDFPFISHDLYPPSVPTNPIRPSLVKEQTMPRSLATVFQERGQGVNYTTQLRDRILGARSVSFRFFEVRISKALPVQFLSRSPWMWYPIPKKPAIQED